MTNSHRSCRTHCCLLHGCQYGHRDCPVKNGVVNQEYACDYCPTEEDVADAKAIIYDYTWLNKRGLAG